LAGILQRWSIPPQGVIGHSDMAPRRKIDPGARFDWRRLALQGLSVWPEPVAGKGDFAADLQRFGYPEVDEPTLLQAFRLRFRPWAKGALDDTDRALARDLGSAYPA
jgi:N-acetylmuramoyl-L-alanine amidase